jgi:hypothetical protein
MVRHRERAQLADHLSNALAFLANDHLIAAGPKPMPLGKRTVSLLPL